MPSHTPFVPGGSGVHAVVGPFRASCEPLSPSPCPGTQAWVDLGNVRAPKPAPAKDKEAADGSSAKDAKQPAGKAGTAQDDSAQEPPAGQGSTGKGEDAKTEL